MPIPDTKYNKSVNELTLYIELSNNSLFHNIEAENKGCNNIDTTITFISNTNNTPYLTNKASYLIHEFSHIRNCVTQFSDDQHEMFKNKTTSDTACQSCDISNTSSHSLEHTQRLIQNQARVQSSLYTYNLSSLSINNEFDKTKERWDNRSDRKQKHGQESQNNSSIKANHGVDIKHNSYHRYLGKKTGNYLLQENKSSNLKPKYGNKTYKFGLIQCKSNCYQ